MRAMGAYVGNHLVQEYSCRALANLACNPMNSDAIRMGEGIYAIVRGMQAHEANKVVQENAFWALANLASNEESPNGRRYPCNSPWDGMSSASRWYTRTSVSRFAKPFF